MKKIFRLKKVKNLNSKLKKLSPTLKLKQKVAKYRLYNRMFQKYSVKGLNYSFKMKKVIRKLEKYKSSLKYALSSKLKHRMNIMAKKDLVLYTKRNFTKRSFFFKVLRKSIRKKLVLKRSLKKKPNFSKKNLLDKRFMFKARSSLINTKRFLYRKQFPKIKGRRNRNFNFVYYNNIDRTITKFNIGRIVISYFENNTFINIHNSKKMLKVFSAGLLGFKGPKRSTPFSRQIVARKAVKYLLKTKINVLDIFLNSNYNRWYYFLFKEFSKPKVKPYVIRYLISNNPRSHGFMRDKKHRRK